MIELKKLTKKYVLPNKESVIALNEVDLRFGDKGMVFIVGKSGCGKSTLLNVLGGLDKFDGGDLYFKGKSFKDFKDGDYENYRNNNVGFVFQESNLLESFSVGENLALAVELQGKTADKTQIAEILKSVGLDGISDRKVTALSGGQKQRVAVARALIKNSDVILADEPTGNLDSGSAKELFDLLKEISKDKLVIVVSHDVESANIYGDRIVEMSDGKVIRDENAPDTAETVAETEGKSVKNGRMKFPKMLKLSARNLRTRIVRLIVMIVLFSVSLGVFGVGLSAYTANMVDVAEDAYKQLGAKSLTLSWSGMNGNAYVRERNRYFTQEEIDETEQKLGHKTLPIYYPTEDYFVQTEVAPIRRGDEGYVPFYDVDITMSGYVCLDGVDLSEYGLEIVAGRLPENRDEVAIPYYAFVLYQKLGVRGDKEFDYDTPEKILGKKVNYYNEDRTIVGVIDTGIDLSKYEDLKKTTSQGSMESKICNSLHGAIFVNSEMLSVPTTTCEYTVANQYTEHATVHTAETYNGVQFIKWKNELYSREIAISRRALLAEIYVNKLGMSYNEFYAQLKNGEFDNEGVSELLEKLSSELIFVKRKIRDTATGTYSKEKIFRVVGITPRDYEECISANDFSEYWLPAEDCVIALTVGTRENPERYKYIAEIASEAALADGNEEMQEIERLNVSSSIRYGLEFVAYQMDGYVKAGLLGTVLFGVFAVLLILNFFFVTIKDKHKEIGVLMALGTGKKTIFAIYFMEALIVTLISVIVGTCLCAVGNALINGIFNKLSAVKFHVLQISAFSFCMTLILGLVLAFVGSAGPIFAISRRKPAEIIRS